MAICMPLSQVWDYHVLEMGILIPFSISFLFYTALMTLWEWVPLTHRCTYTSFLYCAQHFFYIITLSTSALPVSFWVVCPNRWNDWGFWVTWGLMMAAMIIPLMGLRRNVL